MSSTSSLPREREQSTAFEGGGEEDDDQPNLDIRGNRARNCVWAGNNVLGGSYPPLCLTTSDHGLFSIAFSLAVGSPDLSEATE